jgi:carbon monoxide dehydrogenase subunit G
MVIEHVFSVDAPVETVWNLLLDVNWLSACMPGCEDIIPMNENRFRVRVRTKVSFIEMTFNIDVAVTNLEPPRHLEFIGRGETDGRLSFLTSETSLDLSSPGGQGTEVALHCRVNLGGKLGSIAHPALRTKANELIGEFVKNIRSRAVVEPFSDRRDK